MLLAAYPGGFQIGASTFEMAILEHIRPRFSTVSTLLLIPQFCPHRPGTVPGGTVLVELAIYWLNAAVNSSSARI